jgi:hypothetical protein
VLFLLAIAGCGGKPADGSGELKGRVLLNGQPIEVQGRNVGIGRVILKFVPLDTNLQTVQTDVAANGSFWIMSANGNGNVGILPGEYKISVVADESGKDKLKGAFSVEKTKLRKTISLPAKEELLIDLSQP